MSEDERYVVRAAWQVMRDLGFPLDVACQFRERLEATIDAMHTEDARQVPGVAEDLRLDGAAA